MGFFRLRRAKTLKVLVISVVAVVLLPTALYASLVAINEYSAWRMSKMLDSLETIHVGDPAERVLDQIEHCTVEQSGSEYTCQVIDLPLHFKFLQKLTWKLPDDWSVSEFLRRIGLRGRYLAIWTRIDHGHVQTASVLLIVVGRYESLGSKWEIAERIPPEYDKPSLNSLDRRTYMSWFHITSVPSGEGFKVYVTPASSPEELRARHVSRRCLFSFRGCDGLCELLPDAVPVLSERKRSWGGCTSVPSAKCDLKYDECRSTFSH